MTAYQDKRTKKRKEKQKNEFVKEKNDRYEYKIQEMKETLSPTI